MAASEAPSYVVSAAGPGGAQPLPSEEAAPEQAGPDASGMQGELLVAPDVTGSDLTQEDYTQVGSIYGLACGLVLAACKILHA